MCWAPGFEPEWVIDHIPPPCLESREAPLWITMDLSLTFTKNCHTLNGQAPKIQGTGHGIVSLLLLLNMMALIWEEFLPVVHKLFVLLDRNKYGNKHEISV